MDFDGKIKERSGWSWGVLECEGVWDVVGVRRFGELVEQGAFINFVGCGCWLGIAITSRVWKTWVNELE